MKHISLILIIFFSINAHSQELIKGIRYDMPKSEAKKIIYSNNDALKITIGAVEFTSPSVIGNEGLTKIIVFPEKYKIMSTKDKGKEATYNKINDLKNFFLSKKYDLVYENNLTDANNWLGATQGNALLFQKDSVYLSVIFTGQNQQSGFQTIVNYDLSIKITSTTIDPILFKRYFAIPIPSSNQKAENIF